MKNFILALSLFGTLSSAFAYEVTKKDNNGFTCEDYQSAAKAVNSALLKANFQQKLTITACESNRVKDNWYQGARVETDVTMNFGDEECQSEMVYPFKLSMKEVNLYSAMALSKAMKFKILNDNSTASNASIILNEVWFAIPACLLSK